MGKPHKAPPDDKIDHRKDQYYWMNLPDQSISINDRLGYLGPEL